MNRGGDRTPHHGTDTLTPQNPCGYPVLEKNQEEGNLPPYPLIEVGNSLFLIKSRDHNLIEELCRFSESLNGTPRSIVRFTNSLIHCTEQGRLPAWGWQRLPAKSR